MLEEMNDGHFPDSVAVLSLAGEVMEGLRLGAPLTRVRAAVPRQPIGGATGEDLELTFRELYEDLSLLYTALPQLATRTIDIYDIFAVRRDALTLRMNELRLEVGTLLAQLSAGGRASILDSFTNLTKVDLERTTAHIELDECLVTLATDGASSVRYDGTHVKVERVKRPAGTVEPGQPFGAVFSPYRLDSWYASVPVTGEYVVYVNVTGADYRRAASRRSRSTGSASSPPGPCGWASSGARTATTGTPWPRWWGRSCATAGPSSSPRCRSAT